MAQLSSCGCFRISWSVPSSQSAARRPSASNFEPALMMAESPKSVTCREKTHATPAPVPVSRSHVEGIAFTRMDSGSCYRKATLLPSCLSAGRSLPMALTKIFRQERSAWTWAKRSSRHHTQACWALQTKTASIASLMLSRLGPRPHEPAAGSPFPQQSAQSYYS